MSPMQYLIPVCTSIVCRRLRPISPRRCCPPAPPCTPAWPVSPPTPPPGRPPARAGSTHQSQTCKQYTCLVFSRNSHIQMLIYLLYLPCASYLQQFQKSVRLALIVPFNNHIQRHIQGIINYWHLSMFYLLTNGPILSSVTIEEENLIQEQLSKSFYVVFHTFLLFIFYLRSNSIDRSVCNFFLFLVLSMYKLTNKLIEIE